MVEVMIEKWSNRDGSADYFWSAWQNGRRIRMGGPHDSVEGAEEQGVGFCLRGLGARPDAVTRL